MEIVKGRGYLFGYFEHLLFFQLLVVFVNYFVERSSGDVLSYHIVVQIVVERNTHVKDDIRMAEDINHIDFFQKVLDRLLSDLPLSKPFDGHFSPQPLAYKDIPVASRPDDILTL
jgi:hypothetical protein